MNEDGPKRPGNSGGGREIAFGGREGIGGGCALEEETSDKKIENRLGERKKKEREITHRARKTKTFVQTPAPWVIAFTPKASNALRTTRTVVQPW